MFNQPLFKRTVKEHTLKYYASFKPCGLSLNSLIGYIDGEADLKTLNNNPDAYLTQVIGGKTC